MILFLFPSKRAFLLLVCFPTLRGFVISSVTSHSYARTANTGAPRRPDNHSFCLQAQSFSEISISEEETEYSDSLNVPPDPLLNTNDDFFRNFRATVPLQLQYFLRDSGLLRLIADSLVLLGVPSLLKTFPTAWDDFQTLSGRRKGTSTLIRFESIQYGKHRSQRIEMIQQADQQQLKKFPTNNKWIVFVHGGAWGSGFPLLYRLVANSFLSNSFHVAIVGYRTYPDTSVEGQIADVGNAIDFLRNKEQVRGNGESIDITLMGHSSGAHICMLGIVQSKIQGIQRFVGISGVYDIPHHYQFESKRGVERISPLAPVCGGNLSQWKRNSPSRWHSSSTNTIASLPPTLLLHGDIDSTVPYTSSMGVFHSLQKSQVGNAPIKLKILKGVEHAETILHLMFGGETRDVLLKWITKT